MAGVVYVPEGCGGVKVVKTITSNRGASTRILRRETVQQKVDFRGVRLCSRDIVGLASEQQ
jgi:hypothetical protein